MAACLRMEDGCRSFWSKGGVITLSVAHVNFWLLYSFGSVACGKLSRLLNRGA